MVDAPQPTTDEDEDDVFSSSHSTWSSQPDASRRAQPPSRRY